MTKVKRLNYQRRNLWINPFGSKGRDALFGSPQGFFRAAIFRYLRGDRSEAPPEPSLRATRQALCTADTPEVR